VRNETAENFLSLTKEWEKLCCYFSLIKNMVPHEEYAKLFHEEEEEDDNTEPEEITGEEIFEVSRVHAVSYGDPEKKKKNENKPGLYFKVSFVQHSIYFFRSLLKYLIRFAPISLM
jgi:DNA (cytosine-5)-methyltransferase 1